MSELTRVVPASAGQVLEKLQKIADNYSYVESIQVVPSSEGARIVIDLSGLANAFGHPDFYLPVRDVAGADLLVRRLTHKLRGGAAPTLDDARQLFNLVVR